MSRDSNHPMPQELLVGGGGSGRAAIKEYEQYAERKRREDKTYHELAQTVAHFTRPAL